MVHFSYLFSCLFVGLSALLLSPVTCQKDKRTMKLVMVNAVSSNLFSLCKLKSVLFGKKVIPLRPATAIITLFSVASATFCAVILEFCNIGFAKIDQQV